MMEPPVHNTDVLAGMGIILLLFIPLIAGYLFNRHLTSGRMKPPKAPKPKIRITGVPRLCHQHLTSEWNFSRFALLVLDKKDCWDCIKKLD